eukprot:TRINITY_DN5163_c0_g1_i2.p1 TRINITY_DN5163_c0_g1~~TRINITY_DN5163_c0_g1_i2.p1  ORF type:complete len:266 (-),score=40.20 TRINITY_DN5163_c0_g1_i2:961-1758(-)
MKSVFRQILVNAEELVGKLFKEVNMPESHALKHCKTVLDNMEKAIQSDEAAGGELSECRHLSLRLAALLHEVDDHKYFGPDSKNAADILDKVLEENEEAKTGKVKEEVLEMISYVSASVNGNSVPLRAEKDPSLLWPRFCDRLESIGVIGAIRCYQYNREVGAALSNENTPRPTSDHQVWDFVLEDRWKEYQNGGQSASMMDHYYDKLLHIAVFKPQVVKNEYLVAEASKRVEPLLRICVEFGKTGTVPENLILSYQKQTAVPCT